MQLRPRSGSHDGYRLGEAGEGGVVVDAADIERYPEQSSGTRQVFVRFVAQAAVVASDELDAAPRHRSLAIVGTMRPATALVVVVLLALIVGAFLWQIYSSGASP